MKKTLPFISALTEMATKMNAVLHKSEACGFFLNCKILHVAYLSWQCIRECLDRHQFWVKNYHRFKYIIIYCQNL